MHTTRRPCRRGPATGSVVAACRDFRQSTPLCWNPLGSLKGLSRSRGQACQIPASRLRQSPRVHGRSLALPSQPAQTRSTNAAIPYNLRYCVCSHVLGHRHGLLVVPCTRRGWLLLSIWRGRSTARLAHSPGSAWLRFPSPKVSTPFRSPPRPDGWMPRDPLPTKQVRRNRMHSMPMHAWGLPWHARHPALGTMQSHTICGARAWHGME